MENFKSIKDYKIISVVDKEIDYIFDDDDHKKDTTDTQTIYQVQSIKDADYIYLMSVGKATNKPGILIKEFLYNENITCKIMSVIYLSSEIFLINDTYEMDILKWILYKNKKVIGIIILHFFTYEHKTNKKNIQDFVSTKTTPVPLHGYFKYVYYYCDNDKIMHKLLLKTMKYFPGNQTMIDIGTNLLYSIEVVIASKN